MFVPAGGVPSLKEGSSAGFKDGGNLEVIDEKERREKTNCSHYCTYKNQ